jgi:hypothetical protein
MSCERYKSILEVLAVGTPKGRAVLATDCDELRIP